jgi:cation transport protein ChaC
MPVKLVLTPELVSRVDRKILQDHLPADPNRIPMTDEDFAAASVDILKHHEGGPLSIFGYGSLLWNPGFEYAERHPARLRGWHRSFCIHLMRFRGSPEQPGLMLALEHGGSCKGEIFTIAESSVARELDKILRREVPYRRLASPWRWVKVDCGGNRIKALTFYAGMRRDMFYVKLPIVEQARMLARAAGHGGSGAAYLHQTVVKLDELGIHDPYLWELQHRVAQEIRAMFPEIAEEIAKQQ